MRKVNRLLRWVVPMGLAVCFLFFVAIEAEAATVCSSSQVCEGTGVLTTYPYCYWDGAYCKWVDASPIRYEYTCDSNCSYGPYLVPICSGNSSTCGVNYNLSYIDCCSGGGAGYDYTTCPSGTALSCGTQEEAINQNKHACLYKITCNKYFWQSKISTSCDINNPAKAICDWNCSCCPTGKVRSCTLGTAYVKDITISEPFNSVENDVAKVTCNTHNDVFVYNTKLREYTDKWDTKYQDWRLHCRTQTCNCITPCVESAPARPTLSSPPNATEVRVGSTIRLDWNAIANWGVGCPTNNNQYEICISGNQTSCNLVNYLDRNLNLFYNWTPSTKDNYVTWSVRAFNGSKYSIESAVRNVCVEGFNAADTAYVSAWSACSDATHTRTREYCKEDCGTNDCLGIPLVEDCRGEIRGTLFDASNIDNCTFSYDANGYAILPVGTPGIGSSDFGLTDVTIGGTHPWSPLSPLIRTNAAGNFNISVYPNATYQFGFDQLADAYNVPPKLKCSGPQAVVPDNLPGCNTQPCSVVKQMSFGFTRVFGGWWQTVGGSVHGEKGIRSVIPSSVPPTEQFLILPVGSKWGFLSYGVPRPVAGWLGTSGALVSSKEWEKQSAYDGLIYDWGFYNNRFNLFTVTPWNGTDAISYDPGPNDYMILKADSSVNSFSYNPTGSQKLIVLVNGDVRVTSNLIVPNGAFLMIIAKGTITFDQGVPPDPSVTRADGWFVADNIMVPCKDIDGTLGCDATDDQFLGNGTFIGWGGLNFSRNLGAGNNTTPAEKFTYRQDLFNNAPDPVKIYTKIYKPFVP